MRTRSIGSLRVSIVGVGCANMGRSVDAEGTRTIVGAAIESGINFFDTADSYGVPKTSSESCLGAALKHCRERVIIATKFGRKLDDTHFGAKPDYVRSATEASLKRLQTDRIDLMQIHIPDPATPIEATLGALGDLVKAGKIREIGGSNFTAPELRSVHAAAIASGSPTFASTQASFSLLHRKPVAGLLAECERTGTRLLPYQPLFNGLLTGRYQPGDQATGGGRIATKTARRQAEILSDSNLATVASLMNYAEARGRTLIELAFGWLLSHQLVPSVIAGVSSSAQVKSNASSCNWELSAQEVEEVGQILETRAPSGDLLDINGL